jgi:hypothetical protein
MMDARRIVIDASTLPPSLRQGGFVSLLSDCLPDCQAVWQQSTQPDHIVLLLVAHDDFAGNLLLSLLRSAQQLTPIRTDAEVTLACAPRGWVEDRLTMVYESLSRDFTPPDLQQLGAASRALLVFADTEVMVVNAITSKPSAPSTALVYA